MVTNYRDYRNSAAGRIRRARNLTAAFMFAGAVLLGINALLSVSLMQIAGKTSVASVVYYTPLRSQQMAMMDGVGYGMLGRGKMVEDFVRQYITVRHTVMNDSAQMGARTGPGGTLHQMSHPRIYAKFAADTGAVKDDKDIKNVGQQRDEVDRPQAEVVIRGVKMVEQAEATSRRREVTGHTSLWEVVFDTVSYTPARDSAARSRWKATLVVTTYPVRRQLATYGLNKFIPINPLGLMVVEYNEARVVMK